MTGETTGRTMAEFISLNGITMTSEPAQAPAHSTEWLAGASHWTCKLVKHGVSQLVTSYHMGSAHRDPPSVAGVLDSLRSDAQSYDNARDFEDFAREFGYDTDSRKAERIYRKCGELA